MSTPDFPAASPVCPAYLCPEYAAPRALLCAEDSLYIELAQNPSQHRCNQLLNREPQLSKAVCASVKRVRWRCNDMK